MTFVNELAADRLNMEHEHAEAERLMDAGHSPSDIFEKTGWFPGPDGMLRTEIKDTQAEITDDFKNASPGEQMTLDEAIDDPAFFQAVPEARDALIQVDPDGGRGYYMPGYGEAGLVSVADPYDTEALNHEKQHVVQTLLDFPEESRGADPSVVGEEAYLNNNGEIEAYETGKSLGDDFWDDTPDLLRKAEQEGVADRPDIEPIRPLRLGRL